jgi:hypothetical protein
LGAIGAGELVVGGAHELLAVTLLLAHEDDERRFDHVRERGGSPPPIEEPGSDRGPANAC